jgi:hypothetical protein
VYNRNIQECHTIQATLPQTTERNTNPVIRVKNPSPCESDASEENLLTVNQPTANDVIVFFADPPTTFNQLELQVTIYTSGLNTATPSVRLVTTGTSIDLTVVSVGANKIVAVIPAGTPPGTYDVIVTTDTSTVSCGSVLPQGMRVVEATTIALASIDPQYAWNASDTSFTLRTAMNSSVPFQFTPRIYINPVNNVGIRPLAARAVFLQGPDAATGVVPSGLPPGPYDVVAVNPVRVVLVLHDLHLLGWNCRCITWRACRHN